MISDGFSPGTPVSSTNKTDSHGITEILLKVALNTITLTPQINIVLSLLGVCLQVFFLCFLLWFFFKINFYNLLLQILFMVGKGYLRPDYNKIRSDTPKRFRILFQDCCKFDREQRPLFPQVCIEIYLSNSFG